MLKDIFGFAEHQEKSTFGLGYKLTRIGDKSVLNKSSSTIIGKIKIKSIELYAPHYTPSVPQQAILSKQILSKVPTELQYVERSVFMKKVSALKLWTFGLGTQEGINVPIWSIIGFQQRKRQDSQNSNNDSFYRPPVKSAHCIIGT